MNTYQSPLEDIFFTLEAVVDLDLLPGWDAELSREVAAAFAKFAEQEIAPLNESGDREGCRIESGRVRMPSGFRDVYQRYVADGWQGLSVPEALGGQGMSNVLQAVIVEIFSGANHSMQMVVSLVPGAARVLLEFGSPEQQQEIIPLFASGRYLATMCLTESDAGSDLSQIRCRATQRGGRWLLNGEKIFISGGDQDLSEGILHLVLARTGDEGIAGLSLFVCRADLPNGDRNGVAVERIEEKMGLHASPTCQLVFQNAEAELIGRCGEGLKGMFAMMNHARLDVALQGVAHAARAYDIARRFAAERMQGRDMQGARVTIDQHPDVRRMLDEMAALTIGARAVAYKVLALLESGADSDLVEFLTPVAKVFCSQAGIRSAYLGQQVLGGYGYLHEYRIEQCYRDARITAIYEGTNGIHARTLLMRGLAKVTGADRFSTLIQSLAVAAASDVVTTALTQWTRARDQIAARQFPLELAGEFMEITGKLLFLALWAVIGRSLERAPDPALYGRTCDYALKRWQHEIRCTSEWLGSKLSR